MKALIYSIIATSFLITIYIHFSCTDEKKNEFLPLNDGIEKYERILDTLKVDDYSEIELKEVYQPIQIKYHEGFIYVLDFSIMKINRYNEEWELVSIIGHGIGEGPGETKTITDFYIDDESVWIVDSDQFKVSKFNLDGHLLNEKIIDDHPMRIVADDSISNILKIGGKGLFTEINIVNDTKKEFGFFLKDQNQHFISLDGNIEKVNDSLLIYLPRYFSKIYAFNMNTQKLHYHSFIPDGQFLPSSNTQKFGNSSIISTPKNLRYIYREMSLLGERIIVSVYDKGVNEENDFVEKPKIYLDIFDAQSGKYLHSYFVPFWFYRFTISNENIYILSDNKIFEIPLSTS
jgi:hypothetical protein